MTCFMMQIGREIQAKATHTPNDMGPSETENKQTNKTYASVLNAV